MSSPADRHRFAKGDRVIVLRNGRWLPAWVADIWHSYPRVSYFDVLPGGVIIPKYQEVVDPSEIKPMPVSQQLALKKARIQCV